MQICVFGAGGFVGSRLVAWLLTHSNSDIAGIDIDHRGVSDLLSESRFSYYESDPRLDGDLASFVSRADVVVNLLSLAGTSETNGEPSRLVERGVRSDLQVARSCVEHGARLIQWSPAEGLAPWPPVAGEPLRDLATDLPTSLRPGAIDDPRWLSVACRELTERVLYAYGEAGMLDFTIVRPSDMLGASPNEHSLEGSYRSLRRFTVVMAALLDGSPPGGLGEQGMSEATRAVPSRSYIHVEDVVELIGRIVLEGSGDAARQLYEASNPANEISDEDLTALIGELYEQHLASPLPHVDTPEDAAGLPPLLQPLELLEQAVEAFNGDPAPAGPRSGAQAGAGLGWAPRRTLREAIVDSINAHLRAVTEAVPRPHRLSSST